MKVLVLGSGGREHALEWKLGKSKLVEKVFCSPGNGGTKNNIPFESLQKTLDHIGKSKGEWFVVPGQEKFYAEGIVEMFGRQGIATFGPTAGQAKLETSKCHAKEFMKKNGIPTADFKIFDDAENAKDYVRERGAPIVIKADGLAAGKGVVVCSSEDDALGAIENIMVKKEFGNAGNKIVVEDCLKGNEVSYIGLADGKDFVSLETAKDYKKIFDGDKGGNTGGMGAVSPNFFVDEKLQGEMLKIMRKTVRKTGFRGALYGGFMICEGRPFMLEFNVRFGDPETQPTMMRMKSDLLPYLRACVDGNLSELGEIAWDERVAVCLVMASKGYPGKYDVGKEITGLDSIVQGDGAMVFHAGTKRDGQKVVTNGGRVLGVTALGRDLKSAIGKAYANAEKISWDGCYFRKDIGGDILKFIETI